MFAGGYARLANSLKGCCAGGGEFDGCACDENLRVVQYCGSVGSVTARSLMRATAGDASNAVDLYNSATGTWSTAQLSVARGYLAAASVGNLAMFGGGLTSSALLCREGEVGVFTITHDMFLCAAQIIILPHEVLGCAVPHKYY